jgi:DNA-binding response OmpR family regulator
VLLVDDEFSIVETLAEILSFEGFDVATAPDGQQALDVFRARHVDIVIVDYMMPALNGLQFCERMRALPDGARVPIILMSAAPLDRLPGPRLWNASLQKPFEAPRLIDLVARLLAADAREP